MKLSVELTEEESAMLWGLIEGFPGKRELKRPVRGYFYSLIKKLAMAYGAFDTEEGRQEFDKSWGYLERES